MSRKFALQWSATQAHIDEAGYYDWAADKLRAACREAGHDPGNHEVAITIEHADGLGYLLRGTVGIKGKWTLGS